ncbi:MAG: metal-dependent hydrolase [Acidobacteriota bacterium]
MENLTHTLTGLMIAQAGFSRRVPRVAIVCMLAANAPDIDVVSAFFGSHVYLEQHRGFTHGILAVPLLALLCTLAGRVFVRSGYPWLLAFCAALTAGFSHLLLDWTNIYGIRLLAPFSNYWYRGDIASVFDPLLCLLLVAGALWPLLGRLVNQEIGSRTQYGTGTPRTVLVVAAIYLGARGMLHERALAQMNARLYDGQEALSTAAFPHLANPLRWTGLVDLPKSYRILPVNLLTEFDPDAGKVLYKGAEHNRAALAAAKSRPFQSLIQFAPFLFWQVGGDVVPDEVSRVEANDLRFGLPGEGRFTATAVLKPDFTIISSEFHFTPQGELPRPR